VDVVGLVAAILLGALFLFAGASKIALGPAWVDQAAGLGAPRAVAPVVPWLEIVLGALLVSQVAQLLVVVAAIVVLVAFTVLIVVQLAQGRRPPCACFGSWSARPIGPWHVVRNVAMIALGIVALVA
jgi:uncharacterized membrane protein YphA (DoxX/SURF4 family)